MMHDWLMVGALITRAMAYGKDALPDEDERTNERDSDEAEKAARAGANRGDIGYTTIPGNTTSTWPTAISSTTVTTTSAWTLPTTASPTAATTTITATNGLTTTFHPYNSEWYYVLIGFGVAIISLVIIIAVVALILKYRKRSDEDLEKQSATFPPADTTDDPTATKDSLATAGRQLGESTKGSAKNP